MHRLHRFAAIGAALVAALFVSGCAGLGGLPGADVITRADAERALAIAEAGGDELGARCAAYWVEHADDPVADISPAGPLSAYMAARAVRRKVQDGVSDALMTACGPVVMDSRATVRRLLIRAALPGVP